ncbi:MAG: aldehyde dehydrogenase family protein, partial [Anaerolineae bacterium]
KVGDPRDPATDIGPLINIRAAERVESWLNEAVAQGATMLLGGKREGAMIPATVLAEVTPTMKVCIEEVFAPVVTLSPYETWDDAIQQANASNFGLQAGVFTNDIRCMMDAWERLEVGGVQINDVSTFRVDHMPYGGIKDSGLGREGVRYTMQEMTEIRQLVVNMG